MKFKRTTAINKLLKMRKRKRIVQGGTWAGKTYGIIACLIDYATKHPNEVVTVVAETIPAIRDGALRDFLDIMYETGRFVPQRFNRNVLTYHFANGTKFQFKSFENEGKAKASGKRQVLFINECNHIPFRVADALMTRTEKTIWLDFNPDNEFWSHTEIMPMDDAEFLLLKYTDNEALPETILSDLKQKIEKAKTNKYWANWCRVYIDGEIGNLQGVVYNNWQIIDQLPDDARLERIGLDFGYTNDPTAAVGIYKLDDKYVLDQLIYQTGLLNNDIARLLQDYPAQVVCDSAEPKSIRELKRAGVRATAVEKGSDSVRMGIQLVQGVDLLVTARSVDIISEFRKYQWKEERDGTLSLNPIDAFNHAMDATRYGFMSMLAKKGSGKYALAKATRTPR